MDVFTVNDDRLTPRPRTNLATKNHPVAGRDDWRKQLARGAVFQPRIDTNAHEFELQKARVEYALGLRNKTANA